MTYVILIILALVVTAQDIKIKWLEDDIKAIESWYPFCEILKIKIPEKDDFDFDNRRK